MIKIKRIYDKPEKDDGVRILVDRLWPRGMSKEKAHVDIWLKEISPTNELRKWFSHDADKWSEFQSKYKAELKDNKETLNQLKKIAKEEDVTLLFAAKDTEHNEAVFLKKFLSKVK